MGEHVADVSASRAKAGWRRKEGAACLRWLPGRPEELALQRGPEEATMTQRGVVSLFLSEQGHVPLPAATGK